MALGCEAPIDTKPENIKTMVKVAIKYSKMV